MRCPVCELGCLGILGSIARVNEIAILETVYQLHLVTRFSELLLVETSRSAATARGKACDAQEIIRFYV